MYSKVKRLKDKVVTVRIHEDIVELISKIADQRGENLSDFVRRSVLRELARLSYLPDEAKKALEI